MSGAKAFIALIFLCLIANSLGLDPETQKETFFIGCCMVAAGFVAHSEK